MRRLLRIMVALLAGVLSVAAVVMPGNYLEHGFASTSFFQNFPTEPSSPTSWQPNSWDVTTLSTDINAIYPMQAAHGGDCSPPPASHGVTLIPDTLFLCHMHLMTALFDSYAAIYLTPNAMIDFSQGPAVFKWDMSTERRSARDWVEVNIFPYNENFQLAFEDQHWPQDAVSLEMIGGGDLFEPVIIRNYQDEYPNSDMYTSYDSFITPSATRRDTFELDISTTHLKFGMPGYNFWWVDTDIAPLSWDQGVVQIVHRSYNPEKACDFDGSCGPNTWHWDNLSISPAAPFTILRSDARYVNSNSTGQVNFSAPAPSNAYLRFAGIGQPIQMSLDGGQSWQNPQIPYPEGLDDDQEQFWTPVPPGTSSVMFQGTPWYGGDWAVQDITLWAPGQQPATPTNASLPSQTRSPATSAAPTRRSSTTQTQRSSTATTTTTTTRQSSPTQRSSTPARPVATVRGPSAPRTASLSQKSFLPKGVLNLGLLPGQNRPLTGRFPADTIDWGSGWFLSAPVGVLPGKSLTFVSGNTASFLFLTPHQLTSVGAFNAGLLPTLVTLSCDGQPTIQTSLGALQLATIPTNWTGHCEKVTLSSSVGAKTFFTNFTIK